MMNFITTIHAQLTLRLHSHYVNKVLSLCTKTTCPQGSNNNLVYPQMVTVVSINTHGMAWIGIEIEIG